MASTANYNLTLYGTNDTETKHLTFRTTLMGDYEGSNMSIIDRVLKEHADEIDVLKDSPAVITVPATQVIENYYEANNVEGISEYITDMIIVLSVDSRNSGASTLQINSLGSKNILKHDILEGTLTTIEPHELPYTTLLKYNGESWVVIGDCWAKPIMGMIGSLRSEIEEDLVSIEDRISNIDNTSDIDKPISTAVSLALEDKVDTSVFSEYSGSAYGIVAKADIASTAESIQWDNIQDTPTEFTPTAHNHNDSYYTKTEIDDTIGDIDALRDTVNETKEQVEDCEVAINEIYYVCADGVTTAPNTFYYSTGNLSTWIFPKAIAPPSVTTLPSGFLGHSKVAEFEGVNVTTAEGSILGNCTSLTSVSLPALTTTGIRILRNCTSLTSVSLPALTTTGDQLLEGCTSLTSVSLPALTTTGSFLLSGCTSLTSLTVGGANTLTIASAVNNDYRAWKLPVSDMVAFGTALKTATSTTTITFAAAYYNALSSTQKAIFTNKNYTITTV